MTRDSHLEIWGMLNFSAPCSCPQQKPSAGWAWETCLRLQSTTWHRHMKYHLQIFWRPGLSLSHCDAMKHSGTFGLKPGWAMGEPKRKVVAKREVAAEVVAKRKAAAEVVAKRQLETASREPW